MTIIKAVFRILIGILFGLGSAIALTPAFAAFANDQDTIAPIILILLVLLSGFLCLFAPNIRRAFGRGFLMLGASVFALPISTLLLTGRAASEVVGTSQEGTEAYAAAGAGLASFAVTGLATFIGVIVGAILLLTGVILSLGGRREIIVVERNREREASIEK